MMIKEFKELIATDKAFYENESLMYSKSYPKGKQQEKYNQCYLDLLKYRLLYLNDIYDNLPFNEITHTIKSLSDLIDSCDNGENDEVLTEKEERDKIERLKAYMAEEPLSEELLKKMSEDGNGIWSSIDGIATNNEYKFAIIDSLFQVLSLIASNESNKTELVALMNQSKSSFSGRLKEDSGILTCATNISSGSVSSSNTLNFQRFWLNNYLKRLKEILDNFQKGDSSSIRAQNRAATYQFVIGQRDTTIIHIGKQKNKFVELKLKVFNNKPKTVYLEKIIGGFDFFHFYNYKQEIRTNENLDFCIFMRTRGNSSLQTKPCQLQYSQGKEHWKQTILFKED